MRGVITTSPQRRYYGTVLVLLLATTMTAGLLALVGTIKPAKAAFPGSNGKVVFTSIRSIDANDPSSTDEEIFTMNEDGTGLKQLTSNSAHDSEPAWSADGTKIVFMSTRDGQYDIFTMNSDASEQTNRTNDPLTDFSPDWQPV